MNFRFFKIAVLFMGVVSLGACNVKLEDKEQKRLRPSSSEMRATDVEKIIPMEGDRFSIRAIGTLEPHVFRVEILWPNVSGKIQLTRDSRVVGMVPGSQQKFIEENISDGSHLIYKIDHLDNEGVILKSTELAVDIAADKVIDANMVLENDTHIVADRVFLPRGLEITTLSHNLTIEAAEIISHNALLRNFVLPSKASAERPGRSGGEIRLVAQTLKGSLQIYLNGEEGGNGKDSIFFFYPEVTCPATSGGNGGNSGKATVILAENFKNNIFIDRKFGQGGKAGRFGGASFATPLELAAPIKCSANTPATVEGLPGNLMPACILNSLNNSAMCLD